MFRLAKPNRAGFIGSRRFLVCTVSCLLAIGSWQVPLIAHAKKNRTQAQSQPAPAAPAVGKIDPEVLLIEVYKSLGAGHLRVAQDKADALVEAYPNFRLGQ